MKNDNSTSTDILPLLLQRKIIYYCFCLKWENRYLFSKKQKLELALVSWQWFNMSSNVILEVSEVCFKPMKDDIVEMYRHMSSKYCLIKSFNHLFIYDDYHGNQFRDAKLAISKDMITFRHHEEACREIPLQWFQQTCYSTLNHLTIYILSFCPVDHLLGSLLILIDLLTNPNNNNNYHPPSKLPSIISLRQRYEWQNPPYGVSRVLMTYEIMDYISSLVTQATKIECDCNLLYMLPPPPAASSAQQQHTFAYDEFGQLLQVSAPVPSFQSKYTKSMIEFFFSAKSLTTLSMTECPFNQQTNLIEHLPTGIKRLSLEFISINPEIFPYLKRLKALEYLFLPHYDWASSDDYNRALLDAVCDLPLIKVFSVNRVSVSKAAHLTDLFHRAIKKESLTSIGLEMDSLDYGDALQITDSIQHLRVHMKSDIRYRWSDSAKWNLFTNHFNHLHTLSIESKTIITNEHLCDLVMILSNCQSLLTLQLMDCWSTNYYGRLLHNGDHHLDHSVTANFNDLNIILAQNPLPPLTPASLRDSGDNNEPIDQDLKVESNGDITQRTIGHLLEAILAHPTLHNFELESFKSREHMYRCLLDQDYKGGAGGGILVNTLQRTKAFKKILKSLYQHFIIQFKPTDQSFKIKLINSNDIPTSLLNELISTNNINNNNNSNNIKVNINNNNNNSITNNNINKIKNDQKKKNNCSIQ